MSTPWEVLSAAVTRLGDRLDGQPTVREATLVSTDPLMVQFDTDPAPVLAKGGTSKTPGSRVLTVKLKHYIWIVGSGEPLRGTTAERNAIFGIPATDAERVALANRRITWFNTDLGWEESYYSVTGLVGLTAPGLVAGATTGWYPIGLGPYQRLQPTAAFAATAGNPVRSWLGTRYRKGGDAWFTYTDANGRVQVKVAGRYRLQVWTTQQLGSGSANYHLRQLNAGVTEQHVDGLAFTLNASLQTRPNANADMLITANRELDFYLHSGNLSVHQGGGTTLKGEFSVTYLGPPLVAD